MFTYITTPIITPPPICIIIISYILLQRKGFSIVFINKIRKVIHVVYLKNKKTLYLWCITLHINLII